MEQLNEQDISERLGRLMMTMWQLDKTIGSLRKEVERLTAEAKVLGHEEPADTDVR